MLRGLRVSSCMHYLPRLSHVAGPTSSISAQSDLLSKYNQINNNNRNGNIGNKSNGTSDQFVSDRLQAAMRNPSQTAPARLGMWDDEEDDDKMLKVEHFFFSFSSFFTVACFLSFCLVCYFWFRYHLLLFMLHFCFLDGFWSHVGSFIIVTIIPLGHHNSGKKVDKLFRD